jgi:Bacterial SH3 domain
MKNLIIALLLAASCMTACKNESPSEVAQKRQELEAKRAELKEKQELAALEEELKKVSKEIDNAQTNGKAETVSKKNTAPAAKGRIVGTSVILRSAATTQSDKIDNFANNEIVTIMSRNAGNETWYQVYRSNGQTGWVLGDYLMEL